VENKQITRREYAERQAALEYPHDLMARVLYARMLERELVRAEYSATGRKKNG
jgi:hypothetical protein